MHGMKAAKQGRPRPSALPNAGGVRSSVDSVVSQGRRAGQPRSAGGSVSDVSNRDRPISSPTNKNTEGGGRVFGRIRSVPEAGSETDEGKPATRIRVVNPERGPYRTIQAALAEALDGDIVSVSPGFYAEQLKIERDNVRIVGKIRDGAEVGLTGVHSPYTHAHCVKLRPNLLTSQTYYTRSYFSVRRRHGL